MIDKENSRSDRRMIYLTGALVFTSVVSATISYFQWWTMHGQLNEMISTSKQTAKLIKANTALAKSAKKQAAAAIVSAEAARESNKLNRELFEASQRPWIKADITIAGPITFDTSGMYVTLKFDLHNTGHTPAMYTWPGGAFIPLDSTAQGTLLKYNLNCVLSSLLDQTTKTRQASPSSQMKKNRLSLVPL